MSVKRMTRAPKRIGTCTRERETKAGHNMAELVWISVHAELADVNHLLVAFGQRNAHSRVCFHV